MAWTNSVKAVGARRALNARRTRRKEARILKIVRLLSKKPFRHGDITRLAKEYGVVRQTIYNDLRVIREEFKMCPTCGQELPDAYHKL